MAANKSKKKVFRIELKSSGRFKRLLADPSGNGLRCGLVTLRPGESVGEHETTGKEEVLIVLNGNAAVYYGKNKKIKAGRNNFVYIPVDTSHNVKNSGKDILQYIYVTVKLS